LGTMTISFAVSASRMGRRQSLSQKRDRRFESGFLQRGVSCEPSRLDQFVKTRARALKPRVNERLPESEMVLIQSAANPTQSFPRRNRFAARFAEHICGGAD
jgi:hypothetical protein